MTKARELAIKLHEPFYKNEQHFEEVCIKLINDYALSVAKAALLEASNELEKAFEEADTYNLLHGAARVRSIKPETIIEKLNPSDGSEKTKENV